MIEHVLLTASRANIEDCIALALEFDLGIEIMNFAVPDVLDGSWQHDLATYRTILRPVPGPITLHGPFMDMVSGSPDSRINQVTKERYQQTIHIASELGVPLVVFHANFIGALQNPSYRIGWHERNVLFWTEMADYAGSRGVVIALENMWEFEPAIIADLLKAVDHPHLKACLDIGHTVIFGQAHFRLQDWLDTLEPWLVHIHANNNNGVLDEHYGFDWEHGVLDYHTVLEQLRSLENRLNVVLEMWHVDDMRQSLSYFLMEQSRTG